MSYAMSFKISHVYHYQTSKRKYFRGNKSEDLACRQINLYGIIGIISPVFILHLCTYIYIYIYIYCKELKNKKHKILYYTALY